MNESIIILALLAALVSLQYWRGRKLNLAIIRGISNELEKAIRPRDKEYVWIGGYVGIVGRYKLNHENYREVEVTISLLPRHSLLYFPFSLLIGRRDRVYFLIRSREIIEHELHLIPGKRGKKPGDFEELQEDEVVINNTQLKRWYSDQETVQILTGVFKKMVDSSQLKHLAVNRKENAYYAEVGITDNAPVFFIKAFMEVMC